MDKNWFVKHKEGITYFILLVTTVFGATNAFFSYLSSPISSRVSALEEKAMVCGMGLDKLHDKLDLINGRLSNIEGKLSK
jgi:hypothetical protein